MIRTPPANEPSSDLEPRESASCVSRTFPGSRAWQVGARTVHIGAIGVLLGGIAYSAPQPALLWPIVLSVASGAVLLGIDLWQGNGYFTQGNGMAVLLKLALLGLAPVVTFGPELVGGVDSSKVGRLMRRHRKTGSAIAQQAKSATEAADA